MIIEPKGKNAQESHQSWGFGIGFEDLSKCGNIFMMNYVCTWSMHGENFVSSLEVFWDVFLKKP